MSSTLWKSAAACAVAALVLAGCGPSSTPEADRAPVPTATTATATAATAAVPAIATTAPASAASAASLPGDNVTTPRYRIAIHYPTLSAQEAVLAQALRDTSAAAKREFMQALPDPKQFPEFADRQLQLQLDYTLAARTADFTSVRERGMSDTGGAHPIPVDGSFIYDVHAQRVIALDDLFTDPAAARQRLSTLARNALSEKLLAKAPDASEASPEARREWTGNMRQMIDDGTDPTAANFSNFVVRAGAGDTAAGLTLIFSPYQVAPYVYGTQTVDVPAEVFAGLLKPQYRQAFAD